MDEAERCHALAILDRGRIVANGSPQQLMADLPLQVIEIEAEDIAAARAALHELKSLRSLAQMGLRLHALIAPDEADALDRVRSLLAEHGVKAQVRVAPASLEDVFVGATLPAPGGEALDAAGTIATGARDRREGIAADLARSPDCGHGRRDSAAADDDLRLRHQL